MRLYAPVMFSLIIDTLVVRLFSYNLASNTGIVGTFGYITWATTLIQFPQGLVATAISIAILPTLSRQAVLITLENDAPAEDAEAAPHDVASGRAFKDTLGLGLRLTTTLIMPATVGLYVLAVPIIALLFQHGQFTAYDTSITATALRLYLIGLPFAAVDLLLVYAFYARQDTLTPALIGLLSLVIYMVVAIVLFPTAGLFSLMIADSVKHIVHALVSSYFLGRQIHGYGEQRVLLTLAKTGLAALVMGGAALLVLPVLQQRLGGDTLWQEGLVVAIGAALSGVVFLGMASLLRIEELRWLVQLLQQRLRSR
jgi:putative peptidoglycan lipid II flippase